MKEINMKKLENKILLNENYVKIDIEDIKEEKDKGFNELYEYFKKYEIKRGKYLLIVNTNTFKNKFFLLSESFNIINGKDKKNSFNDFEIEELIKEYEDYINKIIFRNVFYFKENLDKNIKTLETGGVLNEK